MIDACLHFTLVLLILERAEVFIPIDFAGLEQVSQMETRMLGAEQGANRAIIAR